MNVWPGRINIVGQLTFEHLGRQYIDANNETNYHRTEL